MQFMGLNYIHQTLIDPKNEKSQYRPSRHQYLYIISCQLFLEYVSLEI
jgi:hypothetical protein